MCVGGRSQCAVLFAGAGAKRFRPSQRPACPPPAPRTPANQWDTESCSGKSQSQDAWKVMSRSCSLLADLYRCVGCAESPRGCHCKHEGFIYGENTKCLSESASFHSLTEHLHSQQHFSSFFSALFLPFHPSLLCISIIPTFRLNHLHTLWQPLRLSKHKLLYISATEKEEEKSGTRAFTASRTWLLRWEAGLLWTCSTWGWNKETRRWWNGLSCVLCVR